MNINYSDLYRFYNTAMMKALRLLVLFGLAILLIISYELILSFTLVLWIYTLFLVNEIFIFYKVNKMYPRETVEVNNGSPINSMLFVTRKVVHFQNIGKMVERLQRQQDVAFLIHRMGGYAYAYVEIDFSELNVSALEITKKVGGSYITSADVFVAYLLLSESGSHVLRSLELTENDLLEILMWTRERFELDIKHSQTLHFTGYGVFDFFIYGWDTLVKQYSYDVTESVINGKEPQVIAREEEFKHMISVLSKSTHNNILLIGEPGVGRSSLVHKFALESYKDPRFVMANRRVYEILADRLLAGVQSSGDLEERLNLLLSELEHTGNVIIFIQNIENIFGGGGFGFDMSGVLFQYLKNGSITIIGTTTPGYYKTILEKKESVMSLFETIRINEPERPQLFKLLAAHVDLIEAEYGITVTYKAIHETIELSSDYLPDRYLPGKAIDLLQDASSRVRLENRKIVASEDVMRIIQEKTNIVLEKPTEDEKKSLLSLEDELHKRVIGQSEAVDAIAKAIRRLRSGFSQHTRPISVFLFLGPTGVGKTETAKALAATYFGDENAMIRLDMSEYQTQNQVNRLLGGVPGGEEIANSLPEAVRLHPFSLLLLDEFEKAHPQVLDIFLSIFEDGRLTDNQGKTVSFKNTIIIATSNSGSEMIREMISQNVPSDVLKQKLIEKLLSDGEYKPELLNRFDDVIVFKPLTTQEAEKIAKLLIGHSLKALEHDQIFLTATDSVAQKIVKESYDEEAGARNMRRYIGATIEDYISKLILEDKLTSGTHATLATDTEGKYIIQ